MAYPFNWKVILVLVLATLGLVLSATRLYQHFQYNQTLHASALSPQKGPQKAIPYVMVNAWKLGQTMVYEQKALELYSQVLSSTQPALKKLAYYNSANIRLKQALRLLDTQGYGAWDQVTPLLALAKDGYRNALSIDPSWLEAKYNMELALRLAPDIKSSQRKSKEDEEEPEGLPQKGWPSIPGFPRGMP
jgi:mxaK protein